MATKRRATDDASGENDQATKFLEDAQRAVDFTFAPTVVLPGDDVTSVLVKTTRRVKLGTCRRFKSAASCVFVCIAAVKMAELDDECKCTNT